MLHPILGQGSSHPAGGPAEDQQIRTSQQPLGGAEGGEQEQEGGDPDAGGRLHGPHDAGGRRGEGALPGGRGLRAHDSG